MLTCLIETRPAQVALRERAVKSEIAAELERNYRHAMRSMLTGGLRDQLRPARGEAAADAFLATVEGVLALGMPKKERDRVLTLVFERLRG